MLRKVHFKWFICVGVSIGTLYFSQAIYDRCKIQALEGVIVYCLPILSVLCFLHFFHLEEQIKWKGSLIQTFKYGKYVLLSSGLFALFNFFSLPEHLHTEPSRSIGLVLTCALTAVYEELLFRGAVLGLLVRQADLRKQDRWNAVMLSALIFGLVHMLNLTQNPDLLLATAGQVIYTFCLGVLLGVIYLRTQNIAIPMILHAVFNFSGSYPDIFAGASEYAGAADISLLSAAIQLAIMLPCAKIGYDMYARRGK